MCPKLLRFSTWRRWIFESLILLRKQLLCGFRFWSFCRAGVSQVSLQVNEGGDGWDLQPLKHKYLCKCVNFDSRRHFQLSRERLLQSHSNGAIQNHDLLSQAKCCSKQMQDEDCTSRLHPISINNFDNSIDFHKETSKYQFVLQPICWTLNLNGPHSYWGINGSWKLWIE